MATDDDPRLLERPRLHDEVIVRRHLHQVGDEVVDAVVLHDERTRRVLRILHVQWQVLALADGTRDVEGLLLAARARGIAIDEDDLRAFLRAMDDEGVLGGRAEAQEESVDDPDADLAEVPLDPIDGWRFTCSGRGVCCQVFPSILFSPLEAARATVVLADELHDFYPKRGAGRDGEALAPVFVEGRCRYLNEDRRCALHARAGMDSKPAGCRAFPTQLVYDGERVRASAAFECACVVDGIGAVDGAPAIPESAQRLRDLARPTRVGRVPERVRLGGDRTADRADVRAFFRALTDAAPPSDVAMGLFMLGDTIAEDGVSEGAVARYAASTFDASAFDATAAVAMIDHAERSFSAWESPLASFRGPSDLTRVGIGWLIASARAAGSNLPPPPAANADDARKETFYVRSSAWVCRDALGSLPLGLALKVRAIRVWLARALGPIAAPDPRADEPLALVEVMFRAHGLDAFAAHFA
ncbi:MAG: YkgJ family cysteine cluster protein [Sandaracinaceae bacterium]